MCTNESTAKESIDIEPRTRRAAEGCMVVVPENDGTGRFDVYSASDGENKTYTVDLPAESCECGDYTHRKPAGGCKHLRRVKLSLGLLPLPADANLDVDEALVRDRAKYGVDPEPDAPTSQATQSDTHEVAVRADGGQLLEATEDTDTCKNGQAGCCGPDGDDLPCFECYKKAGR